MTAYQSTIDLYYFRLHDINTDEWPRSKRPATLDAIHRIGGTAIPETLIQVPVDGVDEDGFLRSEAVDCAAPGSIRRQ